MITFTPTSAEEQIDKLIAHYPDLAVVESSEEKILLRGNITIFRTALGFTLNRSFGIDVLVPLNSEESPIVFDTEEAIDPSYEHRYKSGALCLETDTMLRLSFVDGFDLTRWMEDFVEPYYFSYAYYVRYGEFPFGERPHGLSGLLDTYQQLFNEHDTKVAVRLLRFCGDEKYRGHLGCPCGSDKKLRDCHGDVLFPLMTDPRKKEIVINDLKIIRSQLQK